MILVFLGPPGSGKGTQAKLLAERLKIPHVSLGDLLREEVRKGSAIGKRAQALMDAGKLVPDELTIELTRQKLGNPECKAGCIIDGFPRSKGQADAFDQMLKEMKLELDRVIYFDVPEEQVVRRLVLRAGLEGRADDNESAIRTRFEVYAGQTEPLIERYRKMKKLEKIAASGTIEEVFKRLLAVVENGRN